MACSPRGCNCALAGPAVQGGSGESGDPYIIETGVADFVTSLTRPATPYQGQVIYETDTDRTWMHDGTDWRIQHDPLGYEIVNYTPASLIAATPDLSPPALWLTLPSVTAPPWATRLIAHVHVGLIYSDQVTVYTISPRLGGTPPGNAATATFHGALINGRSDADCIASWSGVVGGTTYPLSLYANRGTTAYVTGQMRADTASRITVELNWKEA